VVNRLWKQFFGNGLSAVLDDLGAQGEPPSHPELLDWLACEFRDSRWDMRHMIRLMVTSATYQQNSSLRPELKDLDPNNRLLASQNPRRLDAEFIRDNALSVAGLLQLDLGGPSAKPYQPPGLLRGTAVTQAVTTSRTRMSASGGAGFTCTGSAPSCTRCWRIPTPRTATSPPALGQGPTRRNKH